MTTTPISLTAIAKDELARVEVERPRTRAAEVAAILCFAGGIQLISGRIVVEAQVDSPLTARRLRLAIADVFGHQSEVIVVTGGALRKGNRYVVRVRHDGESLARRSGLLDARGRPVKGLPPAVVSSTVEDFKGGWRGAFLARVFISEPVRCRSLGYRCSWAAVA